MLGRQFRYWLTFYAVRNKVAQKHGKRRDILIHARAFQCSHIVVSLFYWNNSPRVTASGKHHVHKKSSHTAISIHVRMDIYEHEVPQNHTRRWFRLFSQQIKKGWHAFPHRFMAWWHMH